MKKSLPLFLAMLSVFLSVPSTAGGQPAATLDAGDDVRELQPELTPDGLPTPPAPVALPPGTPKLPNLDSDPGAVIALLRTVHQLAVAKEWGKLLFAVITLLVWISRMIAVKFKVKWLASGWAAIAKSFLLAFTGMLATTWGAGMNPTAMDVFDAFQFGFAAAGGWAVLSYLLELMAKKWAWAKWLADVVIGKTKPETVDAVPAPKPTA